LLGLAVFDPALKYALGETAALPLGGASIDFLSLHDIEAIPVAVSRAEFEPRRRFCLTVVRPIKFGPALRIVRRGFVLGC
jgi:hypothetical protein